MRQQGLGLEVVMVTWISRIFTFVCMLALQYTLLKIHRLRKLLAVEAIPKVSEVWFGVVGFWMCQLVLEAFASGVLSVVFTILLDVDLFTKSSASYDCQCTSGLLGAVRALVDRVVMSWILHHGLVMLLDVVVPYSKDKRRNPATEITGILLRASKLAASIHNITFGSSTGAPHLPPKTLIQHPDSNSTTQTIRLRRTQTDHQKEGQRDLAWNLVIDKEALDEMKETLGPPGGFGELGFSVGRDGVRFEAMGVGTSFVLAFDVAVTKENRVAAVRRKTK